MNLYGVFTHPDTLRFERLLPGPIERVWNFLVDPGLRSRWFAGGTMAKAPGERFELHFNHALITPPDDLPPEKYRDFQGFVRMFCTLARAEAPRLLVFNWEEADGSDSEVTIELAPHGEQVLLVLTHRRLGPGRDMRISVSAGWHTHLRILADCLAERKPPPFWATHTALEVDYAARLA